MVTTRATHPLEILSLISESYEVDTRVSQATTKEELKEIREAFKDQHEVWELQWKRGIRDHNIEEPEATSLARQFKKLRRRLCMKLVTSEFRRKYEDEFAEIQGSSDFFALLESIIGKVLEKDTKIAAEDKLSDITRRVNDEETFTRFYQRIEKLANTASSGEINLKNYFIRKAFFSNLSPEQKRYLLDHSKQDESAEATAKFLDSKQKYKCKPVIKAVSAGELLLQEQVAALTAQLSAVPDLIKTALGQSVDSAVTNQLSSIRDDIGEIKRFSSRPISDTWGSAEISNQLSSLRNEICEIKKISSNPNPDTWGKDRKREQENHVESTARFTRNYDNRQNNHQEQRYQNERGQTETRRKERCQRCGYTNHKTEDCRGGSTKKCFVCDQSGHMSFVCPLKMRFSKN